MKRILIIDDNRSLVEALRLSLRGLGEVWAVESLRETKTFSTQRAWDLVLLDYELGDGTGYEAISDLRQTSPKALIVLLSGKLDKRVLLESYRYELSGVLEKPFTLAQLEEILARHRWSADDVTLGKFPRELRHGSECWSLTDIEYKILEAIRSAREPISKKQIESLVWPNSTISGNLFDTHFYNLRSKIPLLRERIKNVRGLGYHWR